MKNGWAKAPLGELLEIQNGYAFNSKAFTPSEGMPLIRIRDLKGGTETETRFTGEYDQKYVVKAGDLLIGMDGEFGCYEWKGEPALLNQRVCRLQGFTSQLLPRFLFYGVNSHLKAIEDVTGYATVKHLSSKQILNIHFPHPPLPEQRRIVGILNEAFAGIATAKANAEKNLQNARALFESYSQSVFEGKDAEWEQEKMVDVCSVITCGVASTPKYVDENVGIPFLSAQNVREGEVVLEKYRFISKEFHEKLTKKNKPTKGDILYSRVGAKYGEAAVVEHDFDFSVYVSLTLIRPNPEKLSSYFLMYYLNSPLGKLFAKKSITSSGVPNLNVNDVRRFPVGYPSMKQQHRIVDQLKSLAAETKRLESIYQRKLAALDELKKSLLHQAFSGEL